MHSRVICRGFALLLGPVAVLVGQAKPREQVYRVSASSCGPKNVGFSSSGFRTVVDGKVGLVTALHGVVGCGRVVAIHESELGGEYIDDLKLTKISESHDAAFYTSPSLQQPSLPLQAAHGVGQGLLTVFGYPQSLPMQTDHPLQLMVEPRRTLARQFSGTKTENALKQRNSPSIYTEVLMVSGALQAGYSGAPALTSTNSVIGMGNGGLAQGFDQINWLIPLEGIPWHDYDENSAEIARLKGLDAASLFYSEWTGEGDRPRTGVTISGTIYYNGNPATRTTPARAVIELVEVEKWRAIPIDFQYDNRTGTFTIRDVPPGKYTPMVRLEAGYPFYAESGGDYYSRLSGLNPDIVVAPHDTSLQVNLEVIHSIRLKRPVDNQALRTNTSDPPESLYPSFYAPSADVFEWDPVPGAAHYKAYVLTVRAPGQPPLAIIEKELSQPVFAPGLGVSPPGTRYMFRVDAYNSANKRIGDFQNYYKNGTGGWFEFRVIPHP